MKFAIARRLALMMAAASALAAPPALSQGAPANFGAFARPGPNKTVNNAEGPDCTVYRPETLARGVKYPVVLWGNGTGQRPANYAPILDGLAGHGFIVAAANTTNAGSGVQMLACLDYLFAESTKPGSVYFGKIDYHKVGASGHSQGGGGTIMAAHDARIAATAPIQPYTLRLGYQQGAEVMQYGPMLMLSGGADTIARPEPNEKPVFDKTNAPIMWATLQGASHLVPMQTDAGDFRPAVIAWFRYRLMNDRAAAALFEGPRCGLCTASNWTVQRRNGG